MSAKINEKLRLGELPDELNFTASLTPDLDLEKLRYNTFYKSPEFWLHKFENPQAFLNLPGSENIIQSLIENSKTPLEEMISRSTIYDIEQQCEESYKKNKEAKNISYEDQKKSKSLQNRLSKIESQIKQLEIDIQNDDKALASNYDKHVEDANFFIAYNKKKSELDKLLEDWEIVQGEIDSL